MRRARPDALWWMGFALAVSLMLAAGAYWLAEYRYCKARGREWTLLRDALGLPVCVRVERAP